MLSEFGGLAYAPGEDRSWDYQRLDDARTLLQEYSALLAAVHLCSGLAGFCYTQLTATFQEKDGLLYEDRQPKTDLAALALANRGVRTAQQQEHDPEEDEMSYDHIWRGKLQTDTELNETLGVLVNGVSVKNYGLAEMEGYPCGVPGSPGIGATPYECGQMAVSGFHTERSIPARSSDRTSSISRFLGRTDAPSWSEQRG